MPADQPPTIEEQLTLAFELERKRQELAGTVPASPAEPPASAEPASSDAANV